MSIIKRMKGLNYDLSQHERMCVEKAFKCEALRDVISKKALSPQAVQLQPASGRRYDRGASLSGKPLGRLLQRAFQINPDLDV